MLKLQKQIVFFRNPLKIKTFNNDNIKMSYFMYPRIKKNRIFIKDSKCHSYKSRSLFFKIKYIK